MLNDDEAVAVVLGLIGARGSTLGSGDEPVDGALAKILRVLPAQLRTQVVALEQTLGFTAAPPSGAPSAAAWRCCWPTPSGAGGASTPPTRSFSGEPSRRDLSPLGLVVHAGRWYLAAHDHGRDDLRTFRVDRMTGAVVADQPAIAPPDGFDAVGHVSLSLARVPWTWEVEVLLDLPVDEAAGRASRPRSRSWRRPATNAPAHARQHAGVDGRSARRPRLRVHDPPPGRAARERPGALGTTRSLRVAPSEASPVRRRGGLALRA